MRSIIFSIFTLVLLLSSLCLAGDKEGFSGEWEREDGFKWKISGPPKGVDGGMIGFSIGEDPGWSHTLDGMVIDDVFRGEIRRTDDQGCTVTFFVEITYAGKVAQRNDKRSGTFEKMVCKVTHTNGKCGFDRNWTESSVFWK